ncbi:DNA/RNA nuclease SfsA [Prochlorococcus sp. MIT 1223]|uniref:DNA/RNA nuclease SfsA n=1 Tax=Prochlorococcus sp. MIT 1223 TaxID=3096217 RepID=UPI002A74B52B|nr:DNA/RNA nuclease SfsA [Prochlorococcus sp. MIT 1223]
MLDHTLLKFPPLQEGLLLKRYKRFLADIKIDSGEIVTAHCPNTGPMKGVIFEGGRVRIRYAPSPTRKLDWSWEQSEVSLSDGSSCWVGVNTSLANKLVKLLIEAGFLEKELGSIERIRQEVVYGVDRRSRIDLLLTPSENNSDQRNIYVEVKNTTWTQGSLALFPDTITTRGQKHLNELMHILPEYRSVLIPCISRNDVDSFAPGDSADKVYGNLFRKAIEKGMEVFPCCFSFHNDCIKWQGTKTFQKSQFFS